MFKLNQPLDDTIVFKDDVFELDLAFDNVLDVYDLFSEIKNETLMVDAALSLFVGEAVFDAKLSHLPVNERGDLLLAIIEEKLPATQTQKAVKYDILGNEMKSESTDDEQVYSFKYDAEYIFTSFMQAYGIDLHDCFGKLHWKKFVSLFRDLPNDTKIKQVIEIRTWEPDKNTSSEERERMEELQELYRLPEEGDE